VQKKSVLHNITGMPAEGSNFYNWKCSQIRKGHDGLDYKIEKENYSNEGGTV